MPKQIQTPGPGQLLVNRFGMKGRFQPLLDDIVVPVTSVDGFDDVVGFECMFLTPNIPAAAGEQAFVSITCPSNWRIELIDHSFFGNTGSDNVFGTFTSWTHAGATTVTPTSSFIVAKQPGTPQATLLAGSQATASLPATTDAFGFWRNSWGAAAAPLYLPESEGKLGMLLDPGDEFTLWAATANRAVGRWSMRWIEYPLNPTIL